MTRVGLIALMLCAGLWIAGCGGSAYDSIDGPGAPRLSVWPEKGDTVARNAAVFVDVRPSSARVSGFELTEIYRGEAYLVDCSSSRRTYANQYLFCPTELLSARTRYEIWLEVDGAYRYTWSFDTGTGVTGDPDDCYYVEPTASGRGVTLTPGAVTTDPFVPITIPGRPADKQ